MLRKNLPNKRSNSIRTMAWRGCAREYRSLQADNGHLAPTEGYERARELAKHALQISPDLAEAHAQLGDLHLDSGLGWPRKPNFSRRLLSIRRIGLR